MKLVFCDAALCMSFVFIKLAKSHWERHRIYKKFVVHHKDILFSFSSIHIMSSAQYHRLFKYFALFSLYLSIFYFWMFLLLLVTLKLLSKLKFFLKKKRDKIYTYRMGLSKWIPGQCTMRFIRNIFVVCREAVRQTTQQTKPTTTITMKKKTNK